MAATIVTRAGQLAATYKGKAIQVAAIAFGLDGSARTAPSDMPTYSVGTGVPTAAAANGSVYVDEAGATAALALYIRIGGSWVAMDGA
jgi:hypothetical protein